MGGTVRKSTIYREMKILSLLPRSKPPFLDQPYIHFGTTATKLVSSYYIMASRNLKIILLKII